MQNTIKVAIQGDRASFHEIAAMQYYTQPTILIYCQSFAEVFDLLRNGNVDRGFVAVSNSNHGEIREVKELLERSDVTSEGKYVLPIEQHIIGLTGTNLTKVKRVVSHPVALSQCSEYLAERFQNAELQSYHDTSAAVAFVKRLGDSTAVAIGSERAAEIHGLVILQHAIQDDEDNATIFRSILRA